MADSDDAFLDAAVERKLLTGEQADEVRRIRETVAEVGLEQKAEEIAVKKGFLAPEQARRLKREISGLRIGKYQVLERLGEGGAGIVYRANQQPLDRTVAIKVLSAARAASPKYLERFRREARIAVTLNHENIVRGLDYGEADGYHYFVMEFVEGTSLYRVLEAEGTLAERRALEIARQTVSALQHAATYKLVHRDVKPENILITPSGVAKLCDLGLAKPSLVETAQVSGDGTTIGTPTYMSPEQIRGRDEGDFRSDVYSLGATLYHMVTGRPPFTGESADILVRKHLHEAVTDPRELNLKLSSSTAAIVLKMLAKKPEDRYASLDLLAEDLEAVLDGRPPRNTIELGGRRPASAVKMDLAEGKPRRARARSAPRSKLPLVAGVVVVLAAAGAYLALRPPGDGEDGGTGGEEVVEAPPVPSGPTPEERAEELLRETVEWIEANPDATFEAKRDRLELVRKKHPDTRYALQAKEAIAKLEAAKREAAERHRERARRALETRMEHAKGLLEENRLGDAIAELGTYPEGFGDTEYPERARREAERIRREAGERLEEALERAEFETKSGRYDDAEKRLRPFAACGVREFEDRAKKQLERVDQTRRAEAQARERARGEYHKLVGAALAKAGTGDYDVAERMLIDGSGREELVYYQTELDRVAEFVREAERFAEAVRRGAAKLTGGVERLKLLRGARLDVAGKLLGVTSRGLRLARGLGETLIPFEDLSPLDRLRFGFGALDRDRAKDRKAAALYLLVHGFLGESEVEIDEAENLGEDAEPLRALHADYRKWWEERADSEIRRAARYRQEGRLTEARDYLRRAVEKTPWYGPLHRELGRTLIRLEEGGEARAALREAIDRGYDDADIHFWLGEAALLLGEPEEALAEFTRFADGATPADSRLEEVRQRINELRDTALRERTKEVAARAEEAYEEDQWDKAILLYKKLYELAPERKDCVYYVARCHLQKGDVLLGYRHLQDFLALEPVGRNVSDARKILRALIRKHRSTEASEEHRENASTLYDQGRYAAAVRLYDLAIDAAPLSVDAYYRRSLAHLRVGETTWAEEEFRAALHDCEAVETLDPDQNLYIECRAISHYYLKEYDAALESAEEAMRRLPERWQSYNIAGLVHHVQGRGEKAVAVLTSGLRKAPGEVTLYQNRSRAWEGLERYEKAHEDLQEALKRNPTEVQLEQINRALDRLREAREQGR